MTSPLLTMTPCVQKASGSHYTPKILADFVAQQILNVAPFRKNNSVRVLDPAVGDGALLHSLVSKIWSREVRNVHAVGFDTNHSALLEAEVSVAGAFPKITTEFVNEDFLQWTRIRFNSLFENGDTQKFDFVIANPPYVRTQVMGSKKSQGLSEQFGLTGRIDLYFAFLKVLADVLTPEGIIGIIVSNRFMTTRSGEAVRTELLRDYDVLHIWDLGDTQLFEAAVLPAVLLLRRKSGRTTIVGFTSIYSCDSVGDVTSFKNPIEALSHEGFIELTDGRQFVVRQGTLNSGIQMGETWRIQSARTDKWLETVRSNTNRLFGDIGKVRVGVKTTADNVFLRSDWRDDAKRPIPELLRPAITHHVARRWVADRSGSNWEMLYTHHKVDGKRVVIDLTQYEVSKKYLDHHREQLEGRRYVLDAGRKWYEIWVPQDPEGWGQPKLVFRDIAEEPCFWIDDTGAIVNGDCYWLALNQGILTDWLWLALAVGNSTFIESFYDHRFNNKLYSNRRRFMAQYVSLFPLPDLETKNAKRIVSLARSLCKSLSSSNRKIVAEEEELDRTVWSAFGVEKIGG